MSRGATSATARLKSAWKTLSSLPGGKLVFSKMIGRMAPYSGTIGARVDDLSAGHAKVRMRDRKAVRNHLNSIHAIALVNLGEISTGLATLMGLPDDARGILKGVSVEYLKKARGELVAQCDVDVPATVEERFTLDAIANIRDASGDLVTRVTAHWLVGPIQ